MEYKKHSLLEKTIFIDLPHDWIVYKKGDNLLEIKFPFGAYPVLGCYINCFDGPKINSLDKIKEYLLEGVEKKSTLVKEVSKSVFILNYKFKTNNENLATWKILNHIKPRVFREIRFSLAWPDQDEANILVQPILNIMPDVIKNIEFNENITYFDDIAKLNYKLNNIRLKKYFLWNSFNILLPESWNSKLNDNEKLMNLEIDSKKDINLFLEYFDLKKPNNTKKNEELVKSFIGEITKNVTVFDQKLIKADNDNYIFLFYSVEKYQNENVVNYIWYRFFLQENKMKIVSFVLNYKEKNSKEGLAYFKKVDKSVKNSELI